MPIMYPNLDIVHVIESHKKELGNEMETLNLIYSNLVSEESDEFNINQINVMLSDLQQALERVRVRKKDAGVSEIISAFNTLLQVLTSTQLAIQASPIEEDSSIEANAGYAIDEAFLNLEEEAFFLRLQEEFPEAAATIDEISKLNERFTEKLSTLRDKLSERQLISSLRDEILDKKLTIELTNEFRSARFGW